MASDLFTYASSIGVEVWPAERRVVVTPDESPVYGKTAAIDSSDMGVCRRCKTGRVTLIRFNPPYVRRDGKKLPETELRCDFCSYGSRHR